MTVTGEYYNFIDSNPINYQSPNRTVPLDGSFRIIDSTTYGFTIPTYDPTQLLIIDPAVVLDYSTYVAGSNSEYGEGIAVDAMVCDRTVDAHVKSLRRKLGKAKDYIETIRGAGYRFKEA